MIIYILLIAHFLADFTFQPVGLAQKKINNFRLLASHSLIYAGIFFMAVFPFVKFNYAVPTYIIITMAHFLIDWLRTSLDRKYTNRTYKFTSFIVDQILHILIIVSVSFIFSLNTHISFIFRNLMQWNLFENLIIYFLIFVIIWDPAAVFIKKLFLYINAQDSNIGDNNDPQIGRIIGKLERVMISSLVLCGQLGAIGFVLTAKSIARYKQLEDKDFAEKYLVGTLTSATIAFLTTIILKHLL
ncbi:DUF3307 domain-containing protein [Muricomes intestini]|jgi:hypothetical protein|uniref:Uncharacterized protein DUF3307 n=1 Tax=Muricomes intestini TaxID=1796634 RepID=A0A4R3K1X8_9FIRM|nr:DUF3307 domain-containing protein [Muricomes intestini]TCS75969.1 uncharacterized protein DUF3307 [Muricomes intestini]HAX52957.1 DUF3307 domain-containing protein [Lachnospiraceae bacterium]